MTMTLLGPDGKQAPLAPTDAKKAHDPAEVKKHQQNLQALFSQLMQEFVQEMQPNANKVIERDFEKVREHYAEKWREQADILNRSGFPHKVDREAIATEINRLWKEQERQTAMGAGLETIDLHAYELRKVGEIGTGALWISDVAAVSVHRDGLCLVWARKPHEKLEDWARGWMPEPARAADVECVQYTMNELHQLLTSMRVVRIAPLPEALMNKARTPVRRNWWQR